MKKTTVKIGDQVFSSYAQYEKAYIKKWEQLHQFLSPDLNWVKKDWEMRINHPELY